jgi:hypothetical protein
VCVCVCMCACAGGLQAWLPCLVVLACTGGFYLAFFFLLSHNFLQVYHVLDNQVSGSPGRVGPAGASLVSLVRLAGQLVPARDPLGEKNPMPNTLLRRQVGSSTRPPPPALPCR